MRTVVVMGAKYTGVVLLAFCRACLGRIRLLGRALELVQELLREFEALAAFLGFHRNAQLERAFESIVTVRMLHQAYDRARVHLVLFFEQGIPTLGTEIESADSESTRHQLESCHAEQVRGR